MLMMSRNILRSKLMMKPREIKRLEIEESVFRK